MASLFDLVFSGPRLFVGALEAVAKLPREMEALRGEIAGVRDEVAGVREHVERLPGKADRLADSFSRSNDELRQIRDEFRPMMHAAEGVEDEMEEMRETVQRFPFQAALKAVVARRGVAIRPDVRRPLRMLTDSELTELETWLESSSPVAAR